MHPLSPTQHPNIRFRYEQPLDSNYKIQINPPKIQPIFKPMKPYQFIASKLMKVSPEREQQKTMKEFSHIKIIENPSYSKQEIRHQIFQEVGQLRRRSFASAQKQKKQWNLQVQKQELIKQKQQRTVAQLRQNNKNRLKTKIQNLSILPHSSKQKAQIKDQQEPAIIIHPPPKTQPKKQYQNNVNDDYMIKENSIIKGKEQQINFLKFQIESFKRMQKISNENQQIHKRLIRKLNQLQHQNNILNQELRKNNKLSRSRRDQQQHSPQHYHLQQSHCHNKKCQSNKKQKQIVQIDTIRKKIQNQSQQINNDLKLTRFLHPQTVNQRQSNDKKTNLQSVKDYHQNNKYSFQTPKKQNEPLTITFNKNINHQINQQQKQYPKYQNNFVNDQKHKHKERTQKKQINKQFRENYNNIDQPKGYDQSLENIKDIIRKRSNTMKNDLQKIPLHLRLSHMNKQLEIKCDDLANSRKTYRSNSNISISIQDINKNNYFFVQSKYNNY